MRKSKYLILLKPHYSDAVNYCRALCSGMHKVEAEDIFQQAMLKAYVNRCNLKDQNMFRSWLFKIITNCHRNSFRSSFVDLFRSIDPLKIEKDYFVYNDDFFAENQLIIDALSKINEKERSALLLFELGGFSIEEITKIQDENSDSTIKSRLSRTRKKLCDIIVELENNDTNTNLKNPAKRINEADLNKLTYQIIENINTKR